MRTGGNPRRKEQTLLPEVPDGGAHRSGARESLEEQTDTLLDLFVGVQHHPPIRVVDQAHRQRAAQLAAPRLVEDAAAQTGSQHVQLRLTHRALETQQQAVVEVGRVVDTVLVEDERVGQGADLQQPVPVGRIASQPRHLQTEHDASVAEPDLGDQLLEALAIPRRGARQSQVGVDDDDALLRPAQSQGALAQGILALGTLAVFEDLSHRRLSHIQVGIAPQVTRGDLGVCLIDHIRTA